MKIPIITYEVNEKERDEYLIYFSSEGGLILSDKLIWAYTKKQMEEVINFYLENGFIEVIEIWNDEEIKKRYEKDSISKVIVFRKYLRARHRSQDLGGNIKKLYE